MWTLWLVICLFQEVPGAPESVFSLEGNSVSLAMNNQLVDSEIEDASWFFNYTQNLVRFYPHHPNPSGQVKVPASYKHRVEFDSSSLSLELRDLQKRDSGLYRGEINSVEMKKTVEYRLSILEPAARPVITRDTISSSAGLNVTVTCRAGDLLVTSICMNFTCTQEKLTSLFTLAIFSKEGNIVCNHSNPVSWSHTEVDFDQLSLITPKRQSNPYDSSDLIWTVGVLTFIAIIIFVLFSCLLVHTKYKAKSSTGKVYQKVVPPAFLNPENSLTIHSKSPLAEMKRRSPSKFNPNPDAVVNMIKSPAALSTVTSPLTVYSKIQLHSAPLEEPQAEHIYALAP